MDYKDNQLEAQHRSADGKLANRRSVKALFEQIMARRDKIVDRAANGKAIYGARTPVEFTGDPNDWNKQIPLFYDSCLGTYKTDQGAQAYIVITDVYDRRKAAKGMPTGGCVVEVFFEGKSIWTTKESLPAKTLEVLYKTFPKSKPMLFDPDKPILDAEIKDLEEALARKTGRPVSISASYEKGKTFDEMVKEGKKGGSAFGSLAD